VKNPSSWLVEIKEILSDAKQKTKNHFPREMDADVGETAVCLPLVPHRSTIVTLISESDEEQLVV